jgi:hypothetical protein
MPDVLVKRWVQVTCAGDEMGQGSLEGLAWGSRMAENWAGWQVGDNDIDQVYRVVGGSH